MDVDVKLLLPLVCCVLIALSPSQLVSATKEPPSLYGLTDKQLKEKGIFEPLPEPTPLTVSSKGVGKGGKQWNYNSEDQNREGYNDGTKDEFPTEEQSYANPMGSFLPRSVQHSRSPTRPGFLDRDKDDHGLSTNSFGASKSIEPEESTFPPNKQVGSPYYPTQHVSPSKDHRYYGRPDNFRRDTTSQYKSKSVSPFPSDDTERERSSYQEYSEESSNNGKLYDDKGSTPGNEFGDYGDNDGKRYQIVSSTQFRGGSASGLHRKTGSHQNRNYPRSHSSLEIDYLGSDHDDAFRDFDDFQTPVFVRQTKDFASKTLGRSSSSFSKSHFSKFFSHPLASLRSSGYNSFGFKQSDFPSARKADTGYGGFSESVGFLGSDFGAATYDDDIDFSMSHNSAFSRPKRSIRANRKAFLRSSQRSLFDPESFPSAFGNSGANHQGNGHYDEKVENEKTKAPENPKIGVDFHEEPIPVWFQDRGGDAAPPPDTGTAQAQKGQSSGQGGQQNHASSVMYGSNHNSGPNTGNGYGIGAHRGTNYGSGTTSGGDFGMGHNHGNDFGGSQNKGNTFGGSQNYGGEQSQGGQFGGGQNHRSQSRGYQNHVYTIGGGQNHGSHHGDQKLRSHYGSTRDHGSHSGGTPNTGTSYGNPPSQGYTYGSDLYQGSGYGGTASKGSNHGIGQHGTYLDIDEYTRNHYSSRGNNGNNYGFGTNQESNLGSAPSHGSHFDSGSHNANSHGNAIKDANNIQSTSNHGTSFNGGTNLGGNYGSSHTAGRGSQTSAPNYGSSFINEYNHENDYGFGSNFGNTYGNGQNYETSFNNGVNKEGFRHGTSIASNGNKYGSGSFGHNSYSHEQNKAGEQSSRTSNRLKPPASSSPRNIQNSNNHFRNEQGHFGQAPSFDHYTGLNGVSNNEYNKYNVANGSISDFAAGYYGTRNLGGNSGRGTTSHGYGITSGSHIRYGNGMEMGNQMKNYGISPSQSSNFGSGTSIIGAGNGGPGSNLSTKGEYGYGKPSTDTFDYWSDFGKVSQHQTGYVGFPSSSNSNNPKHGGGMNPGSDHSKLGNTNGFPAYGNNQITDNNNKHETKNIIGSTSEIFGYGTQYGTNNKFSTSKYNQYGNNQQSADNQGQMQKGNTQNQRQGMSSNKQPVVNPNSNIQYGENYNRISNNQQFGNTVSSSGSSGRPMRHLEIPEDPDFLVHNPNKRGSD